MGNLTIRSAVALLLITTANFSAASDRYESRQTSHNIHSSDPKVLSDNSTGWQGFPNKGMREPILCPKGISKRVQANTLLELFANKWHDQIVPSSAAELRWVYIKKKEPPKYHFSPFHEPQNRGYVEIFAIIGADGTVVDAQAVCSSDRAFDDIALQAVRDSQYQPASVAGKPIASVIRQPFLFSLPH